MVIACLLSLGASLDEAGRRAGRVRAAARAHGGGGGRPRATSPWPSSTTRTRPMRSRKALRALREHCEGALWCVFGCGGDRDPGKRAIMGGIADELADRIIVTDDNPRSEDPQAITRAIIGGIKSRGVRVIHDRGDAIGTALKEALPKDIVLIAGKGHEDYQIYGETRRSFSDRREAQRYLGVAA